ncbi:MAG: 1,4-dihydroxy-2-naphthoate octaprenyltransferase [Prevotellaceae bacterium]|nr:1,4-dihydroxy-2-naphthoate octaprenyltransferase [Prevotellaceae bacterium]
MGTVKRHSLRAWILAARPKTLAGAVMPVIVGSAWAYADGAMQPRTALLCLLFACGMQIAANFINDLFDYLKGSDRADRLGPERACAQGWISARAMKWGIGTVIVLSCLCGLGILYRFREASPYGGWELVALGACCVLFAFLYTTFLSYQGWGDLLVLVFFGFVPVCGTYYAQTFHLTTNVWVEALICGLVIDTLLVVNNYRDREQDAQSGKRTLIVRLGEPFGRYFYLALGIAAWLLSMRFVHTRDLTLSEFIWAPSLYLYLHFATWRKLVKLHSGKPLNALIGETSRNLLLYGLLMAVALYR